MGSTARVRVATDGSVNVDEIISSGSSVPWAHIGTEDEGYETNGTHGIGLGVSDDWVRYYQVYISDNATGIFGYQVETGGGQFGFDAIHLTLKKSGLYAFTQQLLTSDLVQDVPLRYQSRLQVLGAQVSSGPYGPGGNFRIPGQIGNGAFMQDLEQLWISSDSGDDLWLNRTWVIPIKLYSEASEYYTCDMRLLYYPQTPAADEFWTARVWVARIADINWAATDFSYSHVTHATD